MLALAFLGPVTLRRDGVVLPLSVKKSQALLLLLACQGRMPRARLAALLWPELDESTGRRNLRRELARLRDAGAAELVQADGDLLGLQADVACDLHDDTDPAHADADTLLRWQQPVADGLRLDDAAPFEDWLAQQRERWRLRWRAALDIAVDQCPAEQAAAHLLKLLADDPLQERHHRALMRLHLAAGRREDALAQYARCRTVLADELGLSPMAETEALMAPARAGLPEAPGAAPAPGTAASAAATAGPGPRSAGPLLSGSLPFVGREAEVQALEAAWPQARLMLIEGEGGVGKTRLATDFCAAHGPFASVRCRPGDSAAPYAAFTRALRVLAGDSWAAAGLPAWVMSELVRVLPELGAAPPPLGSADDRLRFFEAAAQAWQRLADDNFDAVVLDDWQHADASSRALLAFVAARAGSGSTRLLVLTRPLGAAAASDTAHPADPLASVAALHLVLGPLPASTVEQLVRQLSGAAAPTRFAGRLRRATGGNPYFLAETLRHLAEAGALRIDAHGSWSTPFDADTEDYHELPLPATVRDAVLGRVQRLPDATRRLLEAACLAHEPFAPALLAAACALSELEALDAIEHALAAALLREHEHGGYAFGHDLAQQALEGALSPERRRLVHRRLALAAEATRAGPALAALHFEAGGEPARAVPCRLAAGDDAQRLFAGAQALLHWQAALALQPGEAQAALLHSRCARALIDLGEGEAALAEVAQLRALAGAGRLSADERVQALLAAAEVEITLNRAPEALPQVEALLQQLPDGRQRTQALRLRGHALQNLGRLEEAAHAVQAALDALQAAPWAGSEGALERAALLDTLQVIEYQRGKVHSALTLSREATALWQAHGDRRSIAKGHYRTGVMLILNDEPEQAAVQLQIARRLASEMHLVEQERDVIVNLIKIEADRGNAAGMLALADVAWQLSPRFGRPRIRMILLQAQCHAHSVLGDLGRALAIAEQVLAESEGTREPVTRQYAVLTVLDLLICVGAFDRGRGLLAQLAGTTELAYLGIKLAFNLAFLELRAGRPAAARQALAAVGDAAALEQVQDRATHALRQAELQLAEGDAAAALATLAPWREGVPNVELQALVWAARLSAQAVLGQVVPTDWRQARTALDDQAIPLLDALALRRALAHSAPDPRDAARLALSFDEVVARVADSLNPWPAYRAGFLALHPSLGADARPVTGPKLT